MRGARLTIFGLVAFALLLVAGPAGARVDGGAATASNRTSFPDPREGGPVDVVQVLVSNDDESGMEIVVTVEGSNRLNADQWVSVYLNWDNDGSTGQREAGGADFLLDATGSAGPAASDLCEWNNTQWSCQPLTSTTNEVLSATSHAFTFSLDVGEKTGAITFWVAGGYKDPATQQNVFDVAPDGDALWTYQIVVADPDGDGFRGATDRCPSVKAGKYDGNRNGCPGPFPYIKPVGPRGEFGASPNGIEARAISFASLPPGATVLVVGAGKREVVRATGAGIANLKRFRGTYRTGTMITVAITRPGYVGWYGTLRFRNGLKLVRAQCIPPTGAQTPRACAGLGGS